MSDFYNAIDEKCNGWMDTSLKIIAEIVIVYLLSNIPFILTALETPIDAEKPVGIIGGFVSVLKNQIEGGQLLTFVCALIAPVVFWSMVEFRKIIWTKILVFVSLILLAAAGYLHGKGSEFVYLSHFSLYQAALVVWVLSVLGNRIPPDKGRYFKEMKSQEQNIIDLTRSR